LYKKPAVKTTVNKTYAIITYRLSTINPGVTRNQIFALIVSTGIAYSCETVAKRKFLLSSDTKKKDHMYKACIRADAITDAHK